MVNISGVEGRSIPVFMGEREADAITAWSFSNTSVLHSTSLYCTVHLLSESKHL